MSTELPKLPWLFKYAQYGGPLIIVLGMSAVVAVPVLRTRIRWLDEHYVLALGLMLLGILVFLAWVVVWRRKLTKRFERYGYRFCPNCGYYLGDRVEEVGVCPECGTRYTARQLQLRWKQLL